ncbi:MAG: hypothetical protein QMD50_02475 [Patescibacteria group bacterium]|nr:hypothetical protein [Patescibacteria group bacterium]
MKKNKLHSKILKESKGHIRETLIDLRKEGTILGYKEGRTESRLLEFIIEIQEQKPRLKIEFIEPVNGWQRKESAYHDQVFLKKMPELQELKETIFRKINVRKKGWQHEEMVLMAAKNMIGRSSVISVYPSTKVQDQYDGVDLRIFCIFNGEQKEVPIQVKSSFEGLKKHVHQFGNKVPALRVGKKDTEFVLKNKLSRIIEAYCNGQILQL